MKKRKQKNYIHPQLQDQSVWMSLAAVFLLLYIAFISFSDHTGLTGSTVQNIAFVKAETQLDFGVDEIPGLEQYKFEVTKTIKNGQMRVDKDETIAFDGPYYSKFTISSPDEDKIGAVQLFLKLDEQLLLSKGISQGDVRVFHQGKEIMAVLAQSEGRYLYYTATTSGIGDFIIGKAAPKAEEPAVEDMPSAVVPAEPRPEATPLVEEALQQPAQAQGGFWVRIAAFFQRFFG